MLSSQTFFHPKEELSAVSLLFVDHHPLVKSKSEVFAIYPTEFNS